ncbi:hypothetical protein L1887_24673 [Cichorium endivia]|nr:hypothetical protein L1887_24673 [Cichorium endivia]
MVANGWIDEDPEEDLDMYMDEDPPSDSDEESDAEVDDLEVVNEPYPIRGRDEPLPPPSHQDAPPHWATQLHSWATEDGLRSTFGMHPSNHAAGPSTPTDRALPLMVPQVSRLDSRVYAFREEVMEIGGEARVRSIPVRRIDEEHDRHSESIQTMQGENTDTTTPGTLLGGEDGRFEATGPAIRD